VSRSFDGRLAARAGRRRRPCIVGCVIVASTARVARVAPAIRFVTLTLFALFIAHDAIYIAQFGFGPGYASAMTATGHDGYYVPASLLVCLAVAVTALLAFRRLAELSRAARPARGYAHLVAPGPGYLAELRSIWLRLAPTVVALFAIQENLEALVAHQHPLGLDVLFGSGAGFVLPILGIVSFLLAVVGAAIRWRTRVLLRLSAMAAAFARPPRRLADPTWTTDRAPLPPAWTLHRLDAGRAPPPIAA